MIRLRSFVCALCCAAALRADSLEAILTRMDANAKQFKSVSAKLREASYNAVLQDTTNQDGELRLRRAKGVLTGVLHFNAPDEHLIGFKGHTIEIFYPKANQVQVYDAGKRAAQLDQFILIAFGAAGSDLKQTYDIKLAGTETVDSQVASHLELTPKSSEARKYATKVELWIPEGKANAVKEKVTEPFRQLPRNYLFRGQAQSVAARFRF